jgi:hypothetical protein
VDFFASIKVLYVCALTLTGYPRRKQRPETLKQALKNRKMRRRAHLKMRRRTHMKLRTNAKSSDPLNG